MKRLGLLGTFTDAVTGSYPTTINAEIQKEYGAQHSASLSIQSLDVATVESLLDSESWDTLTEMVIGCARSFACAPVDGIVVCGSALQPLAPFIRGCTNHPVLDMGFALASRLDGFRIQRVGLLGTRTAREEQMWASALPRFRVILPPTTDSLRLGEQLRIAAQLGQPLPAAFRCEALRIVATLRKEGAQALILASPLLHHLIRSDDTSLHLFDAAEIHAAIAGLWAAHRPVGITPPCCLPAA